jgi:hypothetical protein
VKPFDAKVYVRGHDLACWLLREVEGWDPVPRTLLGEPLVAEARRLVLSTCVALTFMEVRAEQAWEADQAVVRLRELLRLAAAHGSLAPSSHRYAQGELLEIGRMVGGWRKRWRLPGRWSREQEETGRWRRRPRRARRELEEQSEEVPLGLPEQEAPR